MEEFVTYILYSQQHRKIYIGYSASLIQRFYSHNFLARKGHTLRYRPWVVLEVEFFRTKQEAGEGALLKIRKGKAPYLRDDSPSVR